MPETEEIEVTELVEKIDALTLRMEKLEKENSTQKETNLQVTRDLLTLTNSVNSLADAFRKRG